MERYVTWIYRDQMGTYMSTTINHKHTKVIVSDLTWSAWSEADKTGCLGDHLIMVIGQHQSRWNKCERLHWWRDLFLCNTVHIRAIPFEIVRWSGGKNFANPSPHNFIFFADLSPYMFFFVTESSPHIFIFCFPSAPPSGFQME